MAEKMSSNEKLATRSDYERGKLDGMVETTELIREQATEIEKRALASYGVEKFEDLPLDKQEYINGMRKAAKNIWVIYRRRVI